MIHHERRSSKFVSWEGNINLHATEKFDYLIEVSLPFAVSNQPDMYSILVTWRIKFYLIKNQLDFFTGEYQTDYLIEGIPTHYDILNLCKDSYTRMQKAFENRLKMLGITELIKIPFNEESTNKPIQNLLSRL